MRSTSLFLLNVVVSLFCSALLFYAQETKLVIQTGHAAPVNSVAFSPNGKHLASSSVDQTIRIWDVPTGKELSILVGHEASIPRVVFSPNGKTIASAGSSDATVRLWNVENGNPLQIFRKKTGWKLSANELEYFDYDYYESVTDVAFSPDGEILASCNYKAIKLWDVKTGQLLKTIVNHNNWIYSIIFISGGRQIISAGLDRVIRVSDVKTGRVVKIFDDKTPDKDIRFDSLSLSPDKKTLVSAETSNDKIKLWDVQTGTKIKEFSVGDVHVQAVGFLRDGSTIASTGYDGNINLWNIQDGTKNTLTGHTSDIESIAYSPQNDILASGSSDQSIIFWDVKNRKKIRQLGGRTARISSGRFAHKAPLLAIGFTDSIVKLWDLDRGDSRTLNAKAESEPNPEYTFLDGLLEYNFGGRIRVAFTPDDAFLVTGNRDIKLWETKSGKLVWSAQTKDVSVNSLAFSPNGKILASNSLPNGVIRLWNVDNGQQLRELSGHKYPVDEISFSPNGSILASRENSFIKLWKVNDGVEIANFKLSGTSEGIAFSDDGSKLVAISENTIDIWDVTTHVKIATLNMGLPDSKRKLREIVSDIKRDNETVLGDLYATRKDEQGSAFLMDKSSGKLLVTLYRFDNDWIVTTPEGRFDTNKSLDQIEDLHWIVNNEFLKPLPLDVFMRQYYEPGLLPRVLKCEQDRSCDQEFKQLPPITEINRVQPKVTIKEIKPAADAADVLDVTIEVENVIDEINISANDQPKKKKLLSGVFDLRLFRDGQLVGNSTPKQRLEVFIDEVPRFVDVDKKSLFNTPEDLAWRVANDLSNLVNFGPDGKATYVFKNVKIPRTGQNEIKFSAYAFNADRVKSNTARANFKIATPRTRTGKTYLIAIGVDASENPSRVLRQSAKVAQKSQEVLGPRLLSGPENTVSITLTSKYKSEETGELAENNATKSKIKAVFNLLTGNITEEDVNKNLAGIANIDKVELIQPEDELIILFSGHGYRDQNGFFYLLPYDIGTNPEDPEARRKLISSDELSLWLRDINAKEIILIIDSCNSAASIQSGGFKPGPIGSRGLGQLAYDKGMKILAAAQSFNAAWQTCALGQSVLSYALLQEGILEGKADTQEPKRKLTASEWLSYAEGRVPELHRELLDGKFGGICSQSQGSISKDRLQSPKLFDFMTNREPGVLIELR